jgi:hypothetical protein
MAMDGSREKLLDRALAGYRDGARAWSRDALLAVLALLLAGVFVVAPFVRWTNERRAVEDERTRVQQTHDRVVAAAHGVDDLLHAIDRAQAAAATSADHLAGALAERLKRFAGLVQSLQQGAASPAPGALPPPGAPASALPGAAIAEQTAAAPDQPNSPAMAVAQQALPPPAPPPDPASVLKDDFGLTPDEIEKFRRAFADGPGSAAWADASAVSERLFKAEIERTYGRLESTVGDQLNQLRATLAKGLEAIAAKAPELGSGLPTTDQLLPPATVVRLPTDDQLFRSVEGKAEAFDRVALYRVNLDLDAAGAPLHAVADQLAGADARLADQRAKLEASRAKVEQQLKDLDGRLEAIRGEIGGLGAPLRWLAIDTGSFVQLYPSLLALVALWLALRYRRLDDLRVRLEAGYREQGLEERDIRLALYVPEAALGWLQDAPAGLASALRLLRPALAFGLALGIVLVTVWLQRAGDEPSLGWAALPLALGLAACALILTDRRQPVGRLT